MIAALGPASYRGGLPGEFLQGIHAVHMARVRFQDGTFPCFVKLFTPDSGGLANEALGWTLAREVGVNVADRAALLTIRVDQLAGRVPSWLAGAETTTAWAVQQIDGRPMALLHGGSGADDDHWEHVIGSKMGARICALDEWTANNDRHPGNLIRDSRSTWYAIDFSELLGTSLWPAMISLGLLDAGNNQVLRHAEEQLTDKNRRQFHNAVVAAAASHEPAWVKFHPLALALLTEMHGAKAANEVVSFLTARSRPHWMPDRLGVI